MSSFMSEINPFRTNPNYTCVYLVCPLFFYSHLSWYVFLRVWNF